MDEVNVFNWIFLFCYIQDFTVFGVETHLPLLTSLLEPNKILVMVNAICKCYGQAHAQTDGRMPA